MKNLVQHIILIIKNFDVNRTGFIYYDVNRTLMFIEFIMI
jgi:hypothetical protein